MRVAAVDCGTNSIRLLVAEVEGGRLRDLVRRMEIVRLGQGVDRTGVLSPAALERTGSALRDYAQVCADLGVERTRMVATSATRDAAAVLPTRSTAGGMPDRVKCLHALAGHSLAVGPGVNPIGDRAVAEMGEWWAAGPCVAADAE